MLYLIGGVAKSGKSYLAKTIMERKHIPYFSTDFLLWALSDEGQFKHDDPDLIVSKKLEPYLLKIVDYLIKFEDDYVLEGTHITPNLVSQLINKYPKLIRVVFLGYSSEEVDNKYNEIETNGVNDGNRWYKVLSKEQLKTFIKEKIQESSIIKNEAIKYNFSYFDVLNIKEETNSILDVLFKDN